MIRTIRIDDLDIQLEISFKNNKNTYFRFYPNNQIKVTTSNNQSSKQIIEYIISKKQTFLKKIHQSNKQQTIDTSQYLLQGEPYKKVIDDTITHDNQIVFEPNATVDHIKRLYQEFETKRITQLIKKLHQKYQNNPYVSLDNVTYKTRNMTSRYGSCNKQKRTININRKLLHYDEIFLEYVYCHEIAHLKESNHQKPFYELLEKLFPNYKQIRKLLKQINIR